MDFGLLFALPLLLLVAAVLLARRSRKRGWHRSTPGAAAAGAVYGLLNEERRKALEIIVEERAEARDPERKDGNLPDLEDPTARSGKGRD